MKYKLIVNDGMSKKDALHLLDTLERNFTPTFEDWWVSPEAGTMAQHFIPLNDPIGPHFQV